MSVGSVSSSTISSVLQSTVTRLQAQMNIVSSESSTGLVADIGQTLGAESGQDIALHQQMADLAAISSSNTVVTAQLGTAANALTSLQSSASTMLSNIVSGEAAQPGSPGASALAQNAASALSEFSTLLNSDEGGQHVFGGVNSGVAPMTTYAQTPPSAAQTAVDNAFQSTFGFPVTSASVSTITAAQMSSFLSNQFAAQFTGSNWTTNWSSAGAAQSNRIGVNETATNSVTSNDPSFQSMAQGLTMLAEFGGLPLSAGAYSALTSQAQGVMNAANNGLIEANAAVGTVQNQLTQANSAITLQQNVLTTQINARETVNAYDVASQVTALSSQLQTAYSLTAQIHKLSLVSFL